MVHPIIKIFRIAFVAAILSTSCYYDVEEEIYPTTDCSTTDMSYSNDVLPLITSNCYQCHDNASNNGNVDLEGYDQVLIYVNNDRLVGSIEHRPGFSPMPQNRSKLLDCEIEKIVAWIDQGALNN